MAYVRLRVGGGISLSPIRKIYDERLFYFFFKSLDLKKSIKFYINVMLFSLYQDLFILCKINPFIVFDRTTVSVILFSLLCLLSFLLQIKLQRFCLNHAFSYFLEKNQSIENIQNTFYLIQVYILTIFRLMLEYILPHTGLYSHNIQVDVRIHFTSYRFIFSQYLG